MEDRAEVGRKYPVTAAHRRSYERPLRLRAGDVVSVGRRDETWTSWLWCTDARTEVSGWVHEAYLDMRKDGTAWALRDYSSIELTVTPGDALTGFEVVGAWIWCRNAQGDEGRVPEENCSPLA